jgi:hypothetical protein
MIANWKNLTIYTFILAWNSLSSGGGGAPKIGKNMIFFGVKS